MSQPRLISISGPIHSGKTTISRLLALEMRNGVYLDGDGISVVVKRDGNWKSLEQALPKIHAEILRFLKANLERGSDVILDYLIDDATREYFLRNLEGIEFEPKWFLLKPDIDKILTGSETRPNLRDWEVERIKYHYGSPLMQTDLATVIDSTDQAPEETLACVMDTINKVKA